MPIGPSAPPLVAFWYSSTTARGSPTTMPVKMISDMPLPMPRSVICSPSHMMNVVPVVSVSMVISTKPTPGLRTSCSPPIPRCSVMAMPNDCIALRITVR